MHSFKGPIIVGYDSIEGYIALLKLLIRVSAMLQLVGDLMRSNLGWPRATLKHHIVSTAANGAIHSF
eukprot:scaffold4940_cov100-Skeletonema_dohrnii-CCMP3373.AAC.2